MFKAYEPEENPMKIVAKIADDSKPKKGLTKSDLKPLECFVFCGDYNKSVCMMTDEGHVFLTTGNYYRSEKNDTFEILRAIPRNPFEFDIEE